MFHLLLAATLVVLPQPSPTPNAMTQTVHGWTAAVQTCAHIGRPIMYALQATDVALMQRNIGINDGRGQQSTEYDPVTKLFTGSHPHSALGAILAFATYDLIGGALTRRSPDLRCAFEAREVITEVHSIGTMIPKH